MCASVPIDPSKPSQLLVFTEGGWQCALDITIVDRVVSMVEVTPLPQGPNSVLGVINVHGTIVPVISAREGFGLPPREPQQSDLLIIVHTDRRTVALLAETIVDVISFPDEAKIDVAHLLHDTDYVHGMVKLEGSLILIYNLEKFLSLNEEKRLSQALESLS